MTQTTVVPDISVGRARFWVIYIALAAGMFLSSLNHTVLSAAMPTIVGELGGVQFQAWMVTAFLVAATITMPIYGRLGDTYGHGHVYASAVAIFTIGSLGAGMAQDFWTLVIWRAVQGLGGGGLMVLSQSIIGALTPPRDRAKFLAPLNVLFAVSSVLGPLVGGVIVDSFTWHWVFLMNVPVGVLSLIVAIFAIRMPRPIARHRPDIAGMVALSTVTVALLLGIEQLSAHGVAPPTPMALICLSLVVVGVIALVVAERKAEAPILPLWLFKRPQFFLSTAVGFILGLILVAVLSFMPTLLQMGKGQPAAIAGLLMTPMNGAWITISLIVGFAVSRTGRYKAWTLIGGVITVGALTLLSQASLDTPVWMLSVFVLILGLGLGMCFNLLVVIAQNATEKEVLGTATGVHNYIREVGAAIGVAVVGAFFTGNLHRHLTEAYQAHGVTAEQASYLASAVSPEVIASAESALQNALAAAYFDALTPVIFLMVPVMIIAVIMMAFMDRDAFIVADERARLSVEPESEPQSATTSDVIGGEVREPQGRK